MEKLKWVTSQRKVKDLIPLEKNPFGKISDKAKKQLEKKINSLGLFEIPTLDKNNDLLTFNKRRHILMELGRGEEVIDVRIPNRALTDEERKQIIISSNVHEGEWDRAILEEVFTNIDLEAIGLNLNMLDLPDNLKPESDAKGKKKTIELKPFQKTHILISFPPEKILELKPLLDKILNYDFIEYEQASN